MAVSIVLRNKPFTEETEDEIIEALRPSWIQGLSVLGGEPTEEESVAVLVPFLKRVRGELPGKDIWLYSGYTWEMLRGEEILSLVDVLVDGPFLKEQKHYREIEASHYLSWLIRQGKTVESISAYFHTDEDLKDAPPLEKLLPALEESIDSFTEGAYQNYITARENQDWRSTADYRYGYDSGCLTMVIPTGCVKSVHNGVLLHQTCQKSAPLAPYVQKKSRRSDSDLENRYKVVVMPYTLV